MYQAWVDVLNGLGWIRLGKEAVSSALFRVRRPRRCFRFATAVPVSTAGGMLMPTHTCPQHHEFAFFEAIEASQQWWNLTSSSVGSDKMVRLTRDAMMHA